MSFVVHYVVSYVMSNAGEDHSVVPALTFKIWLVGLFVIDPLGRHWLTEMQAHILCTLSRHIHKREAHMHSAQYIIRIASLYGARACEPFLHGSHSGMLQTYVEN